MRNFSLALLANAASVLIAGVAAAQGATQDPAAHRMTVQFPDGSSALIEYSGPVAPRVEIVPATATDFAFAPFWQIGADPVFAEMQRISAMMDRETHAMLRQAASLTTWPAAASPDDVWRIDTNGLPPGARGYSFSATIGPNGLCSQSMTIISQGRDRKPQVVTRKTGNCGEARSGFMMPDAVPNTTQPLPAGTLQVTATPRTPARFVREAMYRPQE